MCWACARKEEASLGKMNNMDIANASGRTLSEICRMLKSRRAEDGFSYRTHHAGRNDPNDPSTWSLPVCHGKTWLAALSIIRYLRAFPRYQDSLSQFDIDFKTILTEDNVPIS